MSEKTLEDWKMTAMLFSRFESGRMLFAGEEAIYFAKAICGELGDDVQTCVKRVLNEWSRPTSPIRNVKPYIHWFIDSRCGSPKVPLYENVIFSNYGDAIEAAVHLFGFESEDWFKKPESIHLHTLRVEVGYDSFSIDMYVDEGLESDGEDSHEFNVLVVDSNIENNRVEIIYGEMETTLPDFKFN